MASRRPGPAPEERAKRLRQLGIIAGLALALVVAIVVIAQIGGDDDGDEAGGSEPADQTAAVEELYQGIPQDGITLGDPKAPVEMLEFADPQCPFCAEYSTNVSPTLIEEYVRSGEMRVSLHLLTFLGLDSERGARLILAASLQDRMWELADLFYRNQGVENTGYTTDEFLRELAEATPGLDVEQALADQNSPKVDRLLEQADSEAQRLGVDSTPSFFTVKRGANPQPLQVSALEPEQFRSQLDQVLGR